MELLPEHKLGRQLAAVHWHMTKRYQEWWTLAELRAVLLSEGIGVSESGVSARIRDLRKPPLNLKVDRQATARKGVYAYRART